MTGEPKPDDEPDFLDDFILEDVPAKDLESMFDPQAAGEAQKASTSPTGEDALFADHTQAAGEASEKFEGGPPFSETGSSTWRGEALELGQDAADKAAGERTDQAAEEAEATFAKQRDSLLNREDEFAIEPDKDLEIDETDDSLLDEAAQAEAADSGEAMPLEVTEEEAPIEPGWEPLAGASLDQLSEVGVERVEGEGEAATEWEDTAAAAAATAEAEEMYAEAADAPAGVVGGRRPVSVLRLFASLAASVAIVAAAALIVWRPEWLGLRAELEQVATVQVQRPRLEVTVQVPPMPLPEVASATPTTEPTPGQVDPTPSVVTNEPTPVTPTPVVEPVQPSPTPTTPETGPGQPAVVQVPSPVDVQTNWPVPVIGPTPVDPKNPFAGAPGLREGLVRVSDDMLVGPSVEGGPVPVDGMMPGSKAFAQLHNGNYFIGSVKTVDTVSITLRLAVGEVTLARASLSRLTALGSTDYEELQKVTAGFVRLRNNNRLVGSILSSIADDHVVLEFRSNRVMVPKSAIDEVVTVEGEDNVRLGTTPQEDDWVRQLSERQLGQPQPPVGTGTVNATPPAPPRK